MLVADRQQVEEGRGHRKARKANEHHRYYGVPNERHIASQRRHNVLAINHGLTLPEELPAGRRTLPARKRPAHNLYVKKYARPATSSHGCHDSGDANTPYRSTQSSIPS